MVALSPFVIAQWPYFKIEQLLRALFAEDGMVATLMHVECVVVGPFAARWAFRDVGEEIA